jgi:hypothetical protein
MKELGADDKGRRMVAVNSNTLKLIIPTGQSITFTRRHIMGVIAQRQAEVDKWKKRLDALDVAVAEGSNGE